MLSHHVFALTRSPPTSRSATCLAPTIASLPTGVSGLSVQGHVEPEGSLGTGQDSVMCWPAPDKVRGQGQLFIVCQDCSGISNVTAATVYSNSSRGLHSTHRSTNDENLDAPKYFIVKSQEYPLTFQTSAFVFIINFTSFCLIIRLVCLQIASVMTAKMIN